MRTLTTDEMAIELTRTLAEQIRVAAPAMPDDLLDDLTEQLVNAFTRVADAAALAERRRLRYGDWA